MTQLEIRELMDKLIKQNEEIQKKADEEKRALTTEELETITANNEKLTELQVRDQAANFKSYTGMPIINVKKRNEEKLQFSMMKAIRDVLNNRKPDDFSREIYEQGDREFRYAGCSATGSIIIPSELRANILAGTPTAGQEIVAENKQAILPPLTDRLIFAQAGATYLQNLTGTVSIPSYAGTTVGWKTEVAEADDGGGAFDEVILAPKRLTAYIDVSKLFLIQDGVGAERLLLDNIVNAVARKLESTILGTATVSATQPSGIGYKLNVSNDGGVASIVPDWISMVAMETRVDAGNALQRNLAYITNSFGRGLLKSTAKGESSDDIMLMTGNELNGYPVLVTNSCPTNAGSGTDGNLIVFANWADLVIGQWGGYDITVDPFSRANYGQVRIVINSYFDAKGLRGSTGSGSTLDEYAISFAAEAIKAAE